MSSTTALGVIIKTEFDEVDIEYGPSPATPSSPHEDLPTDPIDVKPDLPTITEDEQMCLIPSNENVFVEAPPSISVDNSEMKVTLTSEQALTMESELCLSEQDYSVNPQAVNYIDLPQVYPDIQQTPQSQVLPAGSSFIQVSHPGSNYNVQPHSDLQTQSIFTASELSSDTIVSQTLLKKPIRKRIAPIYTLHCPPLLPTANAPESHETVVSGSCQFHLPKPSSNVKKRTIQICSPSKQVITTPITVPINLNMSNVQGEIHGAPMKLNISNIQEKLAYKLNQNVESVRTYGKKQKRNVPAEAVVVNSITEVPPSDSQRSIDCGESIVDSVTITSRIGLDPIRNASDFQKVSEHSNGREKPLGHVTTVEKSVGNQVNTPVHQNPAEDSTIHIKEMETVQDPISHGQELLAAPDSHSKNCSVDASQVQETTIIQFQENISVSNTSQDQMYPQEKQQSGVVVKRKDPLTVSNNPQTETDPIQIVPQTSEQPCKKQKVSVNVPMPINVNPTPSISLDSIEGATSAGPTRFVVVKRTSVRTSQVQTNLNEVKNKTWCGICKEAFTIRKHCKRNIQDTNFSKSCINSSLYRVPVIKRRVYQYLCRECNESFDTWLERNSHELNCAV